MPRFIYVSNAPPFLGRSLVFVRMKPNFGTKLTGRCSLATNFKILSWWCAIHATKIYGNFGLKLNGPVWSNRKTFEKVGPLFSVGPVPIKVHRFRLFLNRSTSPSGTFHVQHGGRHLSWLFYGFFTADLSVLLVHPHVVTTGLQLNRKPSLCLRC